MLVNNSGAQGRNRTTDTKIFSLLLYRLSYLGLGFRVQVALHPCLLPFQHVVRMRITQIPF